MEKIIITYGTFDLFHIGHLNLFKKLKNYGSKLIVGVSTDEFNLLKGKKSIIPFEQRIEIVKNIKLVDAVISEESWEQKIKDIQKFNVQIFGIGSDWKGKFDFLKEYCEVLYVDRTEGVSSSNIRDMFKSIKLVKDQFIQAFDILEQIKRQLD